MLALLDVCSDHLRRRRQSNIDIEEKKRLQTNMRGERSELHGRLEKDGAHLDVHVSELLRCSLPPHDSTDVALVRILFQKVVNG